MDGCNDLQLLIHDDPSIVYFMVLAMVSQHEDALIAAEGAEDQQMTLLKSAGAIADAPAIRRHTQFTCFTSKLVQKCKH